jgi:hypothetical protein
MAIRRISKVAANKNGLNMRNIIEQDFTVQATPEDKIRFLLRYAILAPSTHNSQPWKFKVLRSSCQIYADRAVKIEKGDPQKRDLFISLGCCIENLVTAASYFGVYDRVVLHGDGNLDHPVAEVFFTHLEEGVPATNETYSKRLVAIKKRVNARGQFEQNPVSDAMQTLLRNTNTYPGIQVDLITDKTRIQELADLTTQGLRFAYHDKSFRAEMVEWIHHNLSKKKDGMPGYSLRMALIPSFFFPIILRWFDIGWLVGILNRKSVASAPAIMVVSAREENPTTWMEIGRYVERCMLECYGTGLATSIFVASIEVGAFFKDVKRVMGREENPQFLMCIGSMRSIQKPNLRHPVEAKCMP